MDLFRYSIEIYERIVCDRSAYIGQEHNQRDDLILR